MRLIVTGSGSSGNNYILEANSGKKLLLDLGCPVMDIKKSLNFDLMSIEACVISHIHLDHSKSVKDFLKMEIPVWQPYLEEKEIQTKKFGEFKVSCFAVPHDGVENRAFLIECDKQKILYATDFEYIPYSLKSHNINHALIECNYIPELVDDGDENRNHVVRGHAALETTKNIVEELKTPALRTVIACHLSKQHCIPDKVIDELKNVAKCPIYIAKKGAVINLDLCPF